MVTGRINKAKRLHHETAPAARGSFSLCPLSETPLRIESPSRDRLHAHPSSVLSRLLLAFGLPSRWGGGGTTYGQPEMDLPNCAGHRPASARPLLASLEREIGKYALLSGDAWAGAQRSRIAAQEGALHLPGTDQHYLNASTTRWRAIYVIDTRGRVPSRAIGGAPTATSAKTFVPPYFPRCELTGSGRFFWHRHDAQRAWLLPLVGAVDGERTLGVAIIKVGL